MTAVPVAIPASHGTPLHGAAALLVVVFIGVIGAIVVIGNLLTWRRGRHK